jgi:hypothetical protein
VLRVFQKQLCGEISVSQKIQEFVPTRKYAQRVKSIIKEKVQLYVEDPNGIKILMTMFL